MKVMKQDTEDTWGLGVQLHALLMSQPATLSGPNADLSGQNLVVSVGQEVGWPADRLDAVVNRNICVVHSAGRPDPATDTSPTEPIRLIVCTTNSTHVVSRHAATSHNIQRHNFTECFDRNITLARLYTSSLRMVEDRNM